MAKDEVEAAYFMLLRARSELEALQRYGDYLHEEQRQIRRYRSESQALADTVGRPVRRALRHSDEALNVAFDQRLRLLDDELQRLPDRVAHAQDFVADCEREHQRRSENR